MLFRFFFKQSSRYPYAGLIVNAGNALLRSISGMARNGRAHREEPQKANTRAHCASIAPVWSRWWFFVNLGGCVKGATPLVFICPLHIKVKNN